jgi:hypothetical protein
MKSLRRVNVSFSASPTHGGWFTVDIQGLPISSAALEGVSVAVLDTGTKMPTFGFIAPKSPIFIAVLTAFSQLGIV